MQLLPNPQQFKLRMGGKVLAHGKMGSGEGGMMKIKLLGGRQRNEYEYSWEQDGATGTNDLQKQFAKFLEKYWSELDSERESDG